MRVTAALLADAAAVERGKLYIHGGGWDTIHAISVPTTHPTMSVAILFRFEYSEALNDIPILIELLDEDENPLGPRVEGTVNVGHPPRSKPGAPIFVPQAITITMLQLPKSGGYQFRITSADRELATVPFMVALAPAPQPR